MIVQQIAIYPDNSHPPAQVYAVQGEAGAREIRLALYDGSNTMIGWDSYDVAYAYVKKNDGTIVAIQCSGGNNGYTTRFVLPLQACTVTGYQKIYIQLVSGDMDMRYDNVSLFVKPCDFENALESTSDLGALAEILGNPGMLAEVQETYETVIKGVNLLMDEVTATLDAKVEEVDDKIAEVDVLMEKLNSTDVSTLMEDLAAHEGNSTMHLTESQKKYMNKPVYVIGYTGTGETSRDIAMSITNPSFIFVWEKRKPPMTLDSNGNLKQHWGIASNAASSSYSFSSGIQVIRNGVFRVFQDTVPELQNNVIRNFNAKGCEYQIQYFGPLV